MIKIIKEKFTNLHENDKIVIKNLLMALIVKGGSVLVSLLTVPAFIAYFSNEVVLGVWYTLLSVISLVLNFDFGVGNGIRNSLVDALIEKDYVKGKKVISSGIIANLMICLLLFVISCIVIYNVDLINLFNIDTSLINEEVLRKSMLIVLLGVVVKMFLTIVNSILYALQKSSINNIISLIISVLQLSFVLIFKFENLEQALIYISIFYSIIINIPLIVSGIVIFKKELKSYMPSIKYVDAKSIKSVMSIGGLFFVCQILSMIVVYTNEFLITTFYGPENTVTYQIYYKIMFLISTMFLLMLTPIWSIVTKAQKEKNFIWLKKTFLKLMGISIVAMLLEFLIVPMLQIIFNIWLQKETIQVNYNFAFSFAFFGGIFIVVNTLSTFTCGTGKLKNQTIFYLIAVLIKVIGFIFLKDMALTWNIIIWLSGFAFVPYVIAETLHIFKYLRKNINDQIVLE